MCIRDRSEAEAEQGYVLTCQMRAESDCVIRVPASSQLCKTQQASFEAVSYTHLIKVLH